MKSHCVKKKVVIREANGGGGLGGRLGGTGFKQTFLATVQSYSPMVNNKDNYRANDESSKMTCHEASVQDSYVCTLTPFIIWT